MPKTTIEALLEERGAQYGEAWRIANAFLAGIPLQAVQTAGCLHNYAMIMSKMCRILATPKNPEHWRDIEGYARLQREEFDAQESVQS